MANKVTAMRDPKRVLVQLDPPTPGQVVTVPLALLPAYLNLYRLEAMDSTQVSKLEERTGTRKAPGVAWVKPIEAGPARGEQ